MNQEAFVVRDFDYVVVGAGSAGCVLADRLSADPATTVLLLEAGGEDTDSRISAPWGFAELLGDPASVWHYPTRPLVPARQPEVWVRGRTLGGSSSVNGMVYNRGQAADYDTLARLGNPGWGWDDILPVFRAIEDNPLGASPLRGSGGPLRVSTTAGGDPLLEDVIAAGTRLGWRHAQDLNGSDDERLGYATSTIRDGRRVSAAAAFLHPARGRDNLAVHVHALVDQVVVEGGRAVGVVGRRNGRAFRVRARREVILSAGAVATPKILQLSGIGPAGVLRAAGVDVVRDSPNVGRRMREHRVFLLQFRLAGDLGRNALLGDETARQEAAAQYAATRTGPLAAAPFDVVGFFRSRPGIPRPDAQFQVASFSVVPPEPGKPLTVEREPGMTCVAYALRPDSEGSVRITSKDPDAPPDIDPNYFATEHDRTTSVAVLRGARRLFDTPPLANRIERETVPGPGLRSDEEILAAGLTTGNAGYHAVGTCAMGPGDDDVVDPLLRVRGVANLRVVDASVLPRLVSGNLNAPVSALAWRAAGLIRQDRDADGVRPRT
jgi:choline dehydrogenase